MFSIVLTGLVYEGYDRGACLGQEWAFVFGYAAWWGILLIAHAARRKNLFKPIMVIEGPVVAPDRW